MPIEDLYTDYGIGISSEGERHYRDGWLNVACPYCSGSKGFHLGFNIDEGYYYCWRCGSHPIIKTIAVLLGIGASRARNIVKDYRLDKKGKKSDTARLVKIGLKKFKFPSAVSKMSKPHIKYLERRGFDPDYIEDQWSVLGTSPTSQLDGIQYKYRILAPIYWEGVVVSFQCRDYTNKQKFKYMTCPREREIMHHKYLLYGLPELWKKRVGICVEGIFDAWKLRGYACAVLGIQYTPEQVKLLSQMFDKLFIMFDPELQAQRQGEKLKGELIYRGVEAINYKGLVTDPGAMSDDDAGHLLKELKLI